MAVENIILGYEEFKSKKFKKHKNRFVDLVKQGQKPKVLFITCADSRVSPNLITSTNPGDLFVVRNIGNMVAPYSPDEDYHSTAAAIEYAVSVLNVSDIIVCGHSHCGAIEGLYKELGDCGRFVHVKKWLELGNNAKNYVSLHYSKASLEEKLEATEKTSVMFQLVNLLTYPEVEKRVEEGKLNLRGWYYKIQTGELEYYDDESATFKPLESEKE